MRNVRDKLFYFSLAFAILGIVALSGQDLLAAGKGKKATEKKATDSKLTGLLGKELEKQIVDIGTFDGLKPAEISSGKGTTVIWLNHSINDIRILFKGGDQVTLSCVNPTNFSLQKDGTFQSDVIPYGGTASICFVESGEYKYQVIQISGPEKRDPAKLSNYVRDGVVRIQ